MASRLREVLGELDSVFTTGPGDATKIAWREAGAGRRLVVACGGDGTISEVANGILAANAGAVTDLGILPRGTGGDLRRTLDLPVDPVAAACRIREARVRVIDAGRARYVGVSNWAAWKIATASSGGISHLVRPARATS